MYYRIKENRVYDWADHKYEDDCQELKDWTSEEYRLLAEYFTIFENQLVVPDNIHDVKLEAAKAQKKSEIILAYDYANKYYVANLYDNVYGNVSWLTTWDKVISLCESASREVVPSSVRYYQKDAGESKFSTLLVSDVSVDTLKKQYQILANVQFSVLQPKRDSYYELLQKATTVEQVKEITVNYGYTINEQDSADLAEKTDL
jgi:hypothetical protein